VRDKDKRSKREKSVFSDDNSAREIEERLRDRVSASRRKSKLKPKFPPAHPAGLSIDICPTHTRSAKNLFFISL
jgi:hypothetical protein